MSSNWSASAKSKTMSSKPSKKSTANRPAWIEGEEIIQGLQIPPNDFFYFFLRFLVHKICISTRKGNSIIYIVQTPRVWERKRSLIKESMVNRRSGFFWRAFIMNSLAPTDISVGKENSHLINKKIRLICSSSFTCDWCDRKEPFRPASQRREPQLPKYRQNYHRTHPKESRGRHSQGYRSRYFSSTCYK